MMKRNKNPFEYEGANNLTDDDILEFYIEDYNFTRKWTNWHRLLLNFLLLNT